MIQRRLVAAPLVLALALGACEQGEGPTSLDEEAGPVQTVLAGQETITECSIVDFDGFAHGDPVTGITVQGVPLTLNAIRYDGEVPVDPTAYDVELTGDPLAALNDTHDDTQAERNCTDCAGLGRTLVVPDEDFAVGGDNTEGGSITITGFAADTEGTWEITNYDVIDADLDQGYTELFVDDVFTARNEPRAGNAAVGDVTVPENTITTEVRFEIGNTDIAASSGIDNLRFCRSVEAPPPVECIGLTPGYWKNWDNHYTEEQFLELISLLPAPYNGMTPGQIVAVLNGGRGPDMLPKLEKFYLANLLTVALTGTDLPNPDGASLGDGCTHPELDPTFGEALAAAAEILADPGSFDKDTMEYWKDVLDAYANLGDD